MKSLGMVFLVLGLTQGVVAGEISVSISNVTSTDGEMVFGVFDSEAAYKDQTNPKYSGRTNVSDKQNGFIITDVPTGDYTVVIYQDKNKDGKLNQGMFGRPTEPYGFSRNPRITFSAPKYKDVVFKVAADKKTSLDIRLK